MHEWNDDRIFERAAVGLASLGHDVTLIAPADKDFESEGVKILAITKRKRFLKHLLGPGDAFKRLSEIDAEIYHFFNPNLMWKMKKLSRLGKNVYIDIHENYEARVDKAYLPSFLRKILVRKYRKWENSLCSHFKGITVVTKSMAIKLEDTGRPVLVVDNVPYLKRLEKVHLAVKKADHPTIITSGSHSVARNCMNAVEALPLIVKEIPDVVMKFVGRFQPESYEQDLITRAKQLGVENHFETEGMIPWLENFSRVSSAHIGCVFYNDNLNNRVTLPNRLYEYMFCGLAVLGEDFPEVKKVIESSGGGALVKSNDPNSIAQAAISLLKDRVSLETKTKAARKAIEEVLNFENALKELDNFYLTNI